MSLLRDLTKSEHTELSGIQAVDLRASVPPLPDQVHMTDALWELVDGLSWIQAMQVLHGRGASVEAITEYHAAWEHGMLYGTGDPSKVPVGILSAAAAGRSGVY
jgi:hypothetical protein